MKKFTKNSLTVNMVFYLEKVRLRCCLIMLISSNILTMKLKFLGFYFFILKKWYVLGVYFFIKKSIRQCFTQQITFKLEKLGFDKKLVHPISSYLSDRKQHVRISNVLSSPCSVPSGVLQVSILGPILFLIFIYDMPERVLSSICYLFADDLKLLSISSSINFQNDIDNVYQWSVKNGLIIHPDKTKVICNTPH